MPREGQIVGISSQPGGGSLVIGEVLHIQWTSAPQVVGGDKINLAALKPVSQLAGVDMCA